MGIIPALRGYSGKITIGGKFAFLTSYSLTMNPNLIKSQAAAPIYDSNNSNHYDRIALPPVRDFPIHQLNVSIELSESVYDFLIDQLKKYFRSPISVKFSDDSIGIELSFDKCYVTSFNLSIENNGIATASLTFAYYKETFEFQMKKHDVKAQTNFTGDKNLMPYWKWKFQYGSFANEVNNFALNFTQTVTPKYGCTGSKKDKAIAPIAYVLSVPSITFDVTFILYEKFDFKELDDFNNGHKMDGEMKNVVISYSNGKNIKFSKCYVETYSPQLGNSGSINMFSLSGMVYGTIT